MVELNIINALSKKSYEIEWIEFNTPTGSYVIMPHHAPMILRLSERMPITFTLTSGAQESITPASAIAHITRDKIDVLIREY